MTAREVELFSVEAPGGVDPFAEGGVVSVEKMWGALHFLFTGTAFDVVGGPLSLAILGGSEIGPDNGYGPARMLTPDQVRDVASALRNASFDGLWKRFGAQKMEALEIYPRVWDEDEADLREEIEGYFDELVRCYGAAADAGQAMLLVVC